MPEGINPLAALTATYLVGAAVSGVLYFVLNKDANLIREYSSFNWTPYVLGIVIVGLEVGTIYAYKAGWQISTEAIVQSSFLAIALIVVGVLLFKEHLSWNKIVGILICMIGLVFINYK